MLRAGPKWLPRLGAGIACAAAANDPCVRSAVAACDVCLRPCCLDHSRIDQHGDAICYFCVAEAIQLKQVQGGPRRAPPPWPSPGTANGQRQAPPSPPPGPTEQDLTLARKVLGVKRNTPWSDIEARYKQLLVKHHPDKFVGKSESVRAEHEAKFKQVRSAFDLLKKVYPQ